jgi:hypothetical protein
MRKKLLRLLRLVPIALAFTASVASAQTTGTIIGVVTDAATGRPVAGALVVATSPNLQGEQTAVTDANGNYRIILLPPGQYRLAVQVEGYKPSERSDIRLSADKTLRANITATPEAVQLEEQVVRTGLAPVVNVGSSETGSVVSREFMANVPVGRSFQAIAQSAPQASADSYGVGFQGGQSPENGYIVDGLNITDPVYGAAPGTFSGRSAPTLLSNFIQEVDVKTGSFMAEYGRTTGGIINVQTRSGSNEFHGSVFSNLRPDFLVTPNGKVVGNDGEAVARFSKPSDGTYNLDFGGEVGGPILKDKLWFYAGFAPIIQKNYYDRFQRLNVLLGDPGAPAVCNNKSATDTRCRDGNGFALSNKVAGSDLKVNDGQTSYQWAGKLSFLADENNTLSLATYGQPSTQTVRAFQTLQDDNANFKTAIDSYDVTSHYSGKFLEKRLIVEADVGWHGQRINDEPNAYQSTRPRIVWTDPASPIGYALTAFEPVNGCTDLLHCPQNDYRTGGFGFTDKQNINRYAGKVSVGGLFEAAGSHIAKLGVDLERNDYDQLKRYSGGYFFTARGGNFRATRGYGYLTDGVPTSDLANVFPTGTLQTSSYSNSFAYFLQDGWQIQDTGVTLNLGVRLETQDLRNKGNPVDKLTVNNSWAPRLQAIWDFTGTGRGKVSASYGRFFWSIPLDMGDRSFGNEREINYREPFVACFGLPGAATRYNPGGQVYGQFDPQNLVNQSTGGPGCATNLLAAQTASGFKFSQTGQSSTPVQPNLDATAVDMFGGQLEYEVISDLSVGIEYAGRRQVSLIEDMSPDNGNSYFIANPGRNISWTYGGNTFSARDAVTTDETTGRTIPVTYPKPERSYDGVTVKASKNLSKNWLAQASYTWSVLRGNYAGPFLADYGGAGQGQLDPAITAAFDLPTLLWNTKGYLPGDHTHQVKLFGSYTFNVSPAFNVTAGAGYTGQSGRPMSALGAHPLYGTGLGYIVEQGAAGRTPFTHALDLRGSVSYVISAPYEVRFSVDVFNLLNKQEVLLYDQNYTYDQVHPIQKTGCKVDAVGTSDPAGKLQSSCPDVAFLKTVGGTRANVNPNWGKPLASNLAYQIPIQVRFGLALAF